MEKIDKQRLEEEIDEEMERGDALLTRLLKRVEETKKGDTGVFRSRAHFEKTQHVFQTLEDI